MLDAFPLSRKQALITALVLVAALLLGSKLLLHRGAAGVAAQPFPAPTTGTVASTRPSKLVVDVVGAVLRPGLYRLPTGARVADAVSRAGGLTPRAAEDQVNLAAPVADGEQIVVPARGASAGAAPGGATGGGAASGPVHLNTATVEQLDALPGIGPVTAQKIVDYRAEHGAFTSVDELDGVSGIGPARLEQLRKLVAP
jgi:competence protein ComEA